MWLVFIAVYFDRALYVVVQDGEGDQPLLDVKFPDVSCPGQGIHVATYGGEQRTWLKLALWHSLAQDPSRQVEGPRRSSPQKQPKTTKANKAALKTPATKGAKRTRPGGGDSDSAAGGAHQI